MRGVPLFSAAGRALVERGPAWREHPDYYRGHEQALWERYEEDHCECEPGSPEGPSPACPVHGDPEVVEINPTEDR